MVLRKLSFVFIFIFLIACGEDIETNMSEPMMDFEFTNQADETLSLGDLDGDWWIANFMYTNCRTICPRTTAHMVNVQEKLQDDGLKPQIVSFSVDPAHDTPEVLTEYARDYGADLETWSFLTGYDFATISEISETAFNAALREGAVGQRSHGYGFYLINPQGEIVKKYDGMSTDELDILVDDLRVVLGNN